MTPPGKGTVLLISSVHWHHTWQRHHDIAEGFSQKGYDVIFVEPLPKRWPGLSEWRRVLGRLTGKTAGAGFCRQKEPQSFRLIAPRLMPDVGGVAQWINQKLFVPRLARHLKSLVRDSPSILINYLPTRASIKLLEWLQFDLNVYDCVWDWQNDPYSQGLGPVETELVGKCDMIFADSAYHFNRMKKIHSRVLLVEAGVNLAHFKSLKEKSVKPGRQTDAPLCAYFGNIGLNIDIDLLRQVSQRYSLRLIGPMRVPLENFSSRTEFLGSVPHDQLPALLSSVDVLLLPYRDAAHTQGILPAKTFECLATGKPVVVYGLPNLEGYRDYFYLCRSHKEFLETIPKTLQEDAGQPQKRILFAETHCWDKKIERIEKACQDFLQSAKGKQKTPS